MTLFSAVTTAPRDPILGVNESFNADPNPLKVNLGVGVYFTNEGRIPLLRAVQAAEKARLEAPSPRSYLPIEGAAPYCTAVQKLLFGEASSLIHDGRVITVQTLGGTGALKVGADFLQLLFPEATVAISDPSWENHRALFELAGFPVVNYTYYDSTTQNINLSGMLASLHALPNGSIIILHACCHNPTGMDIATDQWQQIIALCQSKAFIPFLDLAYQGFAVDVKTDSHVIHQFANAGLSFLVANSFSKSFSLYGERIGALSIVTQHKDEATRVLSQVKRLIRANYSNPPTHGSALVSAILQNEILRTLWDQELNEMRDRIKLMRATLVTKLNKLGITRDFSFINTQRGMFSYSGLSAPQIERLKIEHNIYALATGRICIAALNDHNIDRVANAIAAVIA